MIGSAFNDVLIATNARSVFRGEDGKDSLVGGSEADALYGGNGDDRLDGFAGNDTLEGGSGNDILTGGFGADELRGRGGADRLDFDNGDESDPKAPDLILDFTRSQGDRVDLRDIDANEQLAGNQNFAFIGQAQFTGAGQVRFYHDQGMTITEADTSTVIGGPEPVIVLEGLISLRAVDFVL